VKRLERLTALISYMQSRKFTKIAEIESKFRVSERTVFRDIKALEKAGVPLAHEKEKGYYVLNQYFLPPLAFTLEEAKSFIFVEQLARKYTDRETFLHFSNALEKIKNKLKANQLEDVELLQSKVKTYLDPGYSPKYLHTAAQACDQQQVLKIKYEDASGNATERLIEPIGITFYSQSWHLIAFCRLRNDYRDFSLSRIISLQPTSEIFQKQHLTLTEYIKNLEKAQPN